MQDKIDLMAMVANQLTPEECAFMTAGMAVKRMIENLQTSETGITVLQGPFNREPMFVYTNYSEKNGKPELVSTLFLGTPDDEENAKFVLVMLRSKHSPEDNDWTVIPHIGPDWRSKLTEFGGAVFDSCATICLAQEATVNEREGAETPAA